MAKKEIITEIPEEVVVQTKEAVTPTEEVVVPAEVVVNGLIHEHQVGHQSRSFKTPIQK